MALLKAFTDDSAAQTGDKRLFMCGYLHNVDAWKAFSHDWQAELRAWPPIEYFKAKEANSLSGQFDRAEGWDKAKRDAKVRNFAEIIAHYQPLSYQFSINRQLFEEELKPVSPYGLGRPHFTVCYAAVSGIARHVAGQGITDPIEFIFDEQEGVDDDAALFFSELVKAMPPEARHLIDGQPSFQSDRSEGNLPLQAADLLAWHVRREHEGSTTLPLTRLLWNRDSHLGGHIPDEMVRMWAAHHSSQPGIDLVRSKGQWREVKDVSRRLLKAGIDPSKIDGPGMYYPTAAPLRLRLWGRLTRIYGTLRMKWRARLPTGKGRRKR